MIKNNSSTIKISVKQSLGEGELSALVKAVYKKEHCVPRILSVHSGKKYVKIYYKGRFRDIELSKIFEEVDFKKLNEKTQIIREPLFTDKDKTYFLGFVFGRVYPNKAVSCSCQLVSRGSYKVCPICKGAKKIEQFDFDAEEVRLYVKSDKSPLTLCDEKISLIHYQAMRENYRFRKMLENF